MSNMELRLAGSGGQGVILATVILAEAAILAGKYTAQSQAYGPEARGGSCKAEVLISEEPIGFTKVQKPTFLMVLTQKALDDYGHDLPENCVVLADESLQIPHPAASDPASDSAHGAREGWKGYDGQYRGRRRNQRAAGTCVTGRAARGCNAACAQGHGGAQCARLGSRSCPWLT